MSQTTSANASDVVPASPELSSPTKVPTPLPFKQIDRLEACANGHIISDHNPPCAADLHQMLHEIVLDTPIEVPRDLHMASVVKGSMVPSLQDKLRKLPGNDRCCDCGAPHPQWASLTLGTLVCLKCAGAHRSVGIHKSRIRSLDLDSWSSSQTLRMFSGGNARIQGKFRSCGMEWTATGKPLSVSAAHARYGSKIAENYTHALDVKCKASARDSSEDEDEAPGFGGFMLNRMKNLTPCINKVNRSIAAENTSMFCCIGSSLAGLMKSMTGFCNQTGPQRK